MALAESFLAGHPVSGTGGERFQVVVHLDQDVLGPDGALAGTLEDGTHLSAETFRRVACDCGLVAAGAERRSAQHRAPNPYDSARHPSRADAARPWLRVPRLYAHPFPARPSHHATGCTAARPASKTLPCCCSPHHRLVHEGGWTIARGADGELVFTSPAGRGLPVKPRRERVGEHHRRGSANGPTRMA